MKRTTLISTMATLMIAFFAGTLSAASVTITGAGASFPFPVYAQWAYKYGKVQGVRVNYQSIGSGGGIRQIKAKTVDFGASDAPLKLEDLEQSGLIQFPMVMGGVVPVVNIKGLKAGDLNLTPELLAGIFLGDISKWNDPAVVRVNPGVKLPAQAITVVHRSDGSGTTWIFTNYLDKVSSPWRERVGTAKAVNWPTGVGGKGNEGVATYVLQVPGAIGYVEYAYALQNKLNHVKLRNLEGRFVSPSSKTFQAAAASADWEGSKGYYVVLTNQPGEESWPITGASFILLQRNMPDAERARTMLAFFDWCYRHGSEIAQNLDYVPMPDSVINLVNKTWSSSLTSKGSSVWP